MRAESIGLRKYVLLDDNGKKVATLNYEGWLTYQAVVELESGDKINFDSQGFWGQTIEVKQEEKHLATIRMDWLGNVKIHYENAEEPTFILKYTGFWQPKVVLQDGKKNRIAEFLGRFKWSKFAYEYEIIPIAKNIFDDEKDLIITYFAAMYLFRFINSSAG